MVCMLVTSCVALRDASLQLSPILDAETLLERGFSSPALCLECLGVVVADLG